MKDKIYKSAKDFCHKALKDYIETENTHFLVNLAVSAELLGKAFLAGIHPSLIIDKDFDSLLHVCGAGKHSKKSPTNIRTVGAKDVFDRCSQILPKLKEHEQALNVLANVRSGLIHLGEYNVELAKQVFTPYLKFTKIILEELAVPFKEHFGDFSDIASTNIQDSKKEIDVKVQSLLAKARADYKKKFESTNEKVKKDIINTIEKSYVIEKYDEVLTTCPACANMGVLAGSCDVKSWEADFDEYGNPEGAYPIVELYGRSFKCNICGLEIDSSSGLEVAGIELSVRLEDVDPADFQDDNDYDIYR